jgi:serine/threonine protein kinase/tetratricopeptide (TPR) repeat protein
MNSTRWLEIKEIFNAACDLPLENRASFLEKYDVSLRLEVIKLLNANDEAVDFIEEPAMVEVGFTGNDVTDTFIGKRIDSYEILSEIGHGGMGIVYLADHAAESFDKKVAVKLIKRGMDTSAVLKRFVMERQILANLEHPNIASLLDGGTTPDGLPYFVMEYVAGEPITKFCDSHGLDTKGRLELFQKVCAAISYAHQNLIVHRDIKPSNILVTKDGTPKLLDFGIAKLLHPDWSLDTHEATATMFRAMTPEYASPEQLRGMPVTTASDVYSLGVVLYELLTGERPFKIEGLMPEELAQIVLTEEPVKPSSIVSQSIAERGMWNTGLETDKNKKTNTHDGEQKLGIHNPRSAIRNLKGDLDNIILKALSKEPERRYSSVQEFSEDIRRHLVGLPVTATAGTASYRAGRFIKRHRAGVLAAGAIVFTLMCATVITAWQAVVARRERDNAEQRFNQVRKLANTVLFEYHDGIAKLPGSTALREKMVKDALEYLDNLAAENVDDATLQSELATAYFKVGEVQGAPAKSSLGDYGGGLASFRKSLSIRERLFEKDPGNNQLKLELARSYQMVGHLSQVTDDIPAALENYRKAFAIFDSMPLDNSDVKRDFATLHSRFGIALSASGDAVKATESFRRAVVLFNELLAAEPTNRELKRELGIALGLLGDALEEAVDLDGALTAQRTALATLEPLVVETDAQSRRDASAAYGRIGDVLFKLGRYGEALEIQQKVLLLDEGLLRADPSNALARRDVQVDFYKIARNKAELGDINGAIASQRKCIAFCEASVAANPESSESRGDLGVAYYYLGEMLEKNNDLRSALENYRKATEIEEALSAADPANMSALDNVAEDYLKVSDLALKLGNRAEALSGYLKALGIREKIQAEAQEKGESRGVTANIYESLGDYYYSQSRIDKSLENLKEAKSRYQQSFSVWDELSQKNILLAEDADKPSRLKQKIARCEKAIGNH